MSWTLNPLNSADPPGQNAVNGVTQENTIVQDLLINLSPYVLALASTTPITLTATVTEPSAKHGTFVLTGTLTANISIVFPVLCKTVWTIRNNTTGSFTVTGKVAGSAATPITFAQGATTRCLGNGTDLLAL